MELGNMLRNFMGLRRTSFLSKKKVIKIMVDLNND